MKHYCFIILSKMLLLTTLIGFSDETLAQSICNGRSCTEIGTELDTKAIQERIDSVPQYVNGGRFLTQNELRTNFPCGPLPMLGQYARVSDTYETVASVAICETDGNSFYWRPVRTDFAVTLTQTTGNITLTPFVTAPIVIMSGVPSSSMTITPSTTNVWPGAQFRIYMPPSIGFPFSVNISGLVGNGTLTALQGRDYLLTYTSSGWKSN